jgi:hypothetical protein
MQPSSPHTHILRPLFASLLLLVAIPATRAKVATFRQGRIPTDPEVTCLKFSIPLPDGMEWHGTQIVRTSGSLAVFSAMQPSKDDPEFSGIIPFTGIPTDTFNITISGQWIIRPPEGGTGGGTAEPPDLIVPYEYKGFGGLDTTLSISPAKAFCDLENCETITFTASSNNRTPEQLEEVTWTIDNASHGKGRILELDPADLVPAVYEIKATLPVKDEAPLKTTAELVAGRAALELDPVETPEAPGTIKVGDIVNAKINIRPDTALDPGYVALIFSGTGQLTPQNEQNNILKWKSPDQPDTIPFLATAPGQTTAKLQYTCNDGTLTATDSITIEPLEFNLQITDPNSQNSIILTQEAPTSSETFYIAEQEDAGADLELTLVDNEGNSIPFADVTWTITPLNGAPKLWNKTTGNFTEPTVQTTWNRGENQTEKRRYKIQAQYTGTQTQTTPQFQPLETEISIVGIEITQVPEFLFASAEYATTLQWKIHGLDSVDDLTSVQVVFHPKSGSTSPSPLNGAHGEKGFLDYSLKIEGSPNQGFTYETYILSEYIRKNEVAGNISRSASFELLVGVQNIPEFQAKSDSKDMVKFFADNDIYALDIGKASDYTGLKTVTDERAVSLVPPTCRWRNVPTDDNNCKILPGEWNTANTICDYDEEFRSNGYWESPNVPSFSVWEPTYNYPDKPPYATYPIFAEGTKIAVTPTKEVSMTGAGQKIEQTCTIFPPEKEYYMAWDPKRLSFGHYRGEALGYRVGVYVFISYPGKDVTGLNAEVSR